MTSPAAAATAPYPARHTERDRWILARRGARNVVDPQRPSAFLHEEERSATGDIVSVATIFLTNRECPWRCVMCDLWRNTLEETVPLHAIPTQIEYALARLPAARQIKLYNSGSFFDRDAIPREDHPAIAAHARRFDRVVVEAHPALVNESCLRFRDLLGGAGEKRAPQLEIAMGLETVHPDALRALNKQMSLALFARAAAFLKAHAIALRAFVLVQPPFVPEPEALAWTARSVEFALACGATVVSLIPTRSGNGAIDSLIANHQFVPAHLVTLENALDQSLRAPACRVFADLWDLERFSTCAFCFEARRRRLEGMNRTQKVLPRVSCAHCRCA
jgi:radical SAM enzyme (TIGR01210 family)